MHILHFLPSSREFIVAFVIAALMGLFSYVAKLRIEPYANEVLGAYKKSWQENARSRLARIALYRIERRLTRAKSLYLLRSDQAHLIRQICSAVFPALFALLAWSFRSNMIDIIQIVPAYRWVGRYMLVEHVLLESFTVFAICLLIATLKSLNDSYPGSIRKHSQKTRKMLAAYVERYGRPDSFDRIDGELSVLTQEQ